MSQKVPEFLKPRLRLFLSADVVGSTGLKQSRLGRSADEILKQHASWFSTIQGFYFEAQQDFLNQWESDRRERPESQFCFGEAPVLWKTVGDEVLFVKVVSDYRQVAATLRCWIGTIERLRSFVQVKNPRLDVKSTAWLAGFPVENKEVVVSTSELTQATSIDDFYKEAGRILNEHYSGNRTGVLVDFIGPAIDIGFRLAAHSSPRRFVVSVAIPYILSLTNPTADGVIPDFDIFYAGSVPLKGVLGGLSYPLFWIDLSRDRDLWRLEDALSDARPASRDAMRRYCEAFFDAHSAYIFQPFIYSDAEQQIRTRPDWYDELHNRLIANFEDVSTGVEATGADVDGDSIAGPDIHVNVDQISQQVTQELQEQTRPNQQENPANDEGSLFET